MLRSLVEAFQDRTDLPIEISEIRDEIVKQGFQDRIILCSQPLDPGVLKGIYYQWTEHNGVYSDPELISLIVFSNEVNLCWQRLICAKEMVHVCDLQIAKSSSIEEISELARKVIGPFETTDLDVGDLMASFDKLAQYQSLNLLFPKAARNLAKQKLEKDEITTFEIAEWSRIPEELVRLALSEKWETISQLLLAIGNGDAIQNLSDQR
ncbi:hypothetical protein N9O61_06765 [Octadecabacter sp.]|nr:hypothetical protein [Octadecabacter sp.]